MAGNLPVPQGVEAKLVWGLNGIPSALNILHFRHTVGQLHSQARADQLDSLIKTAFSSSALAGQIAPAVSLMRVESRHMDANTDPWYVGSNAAVPGTGTGDRLPPQVCYVVPLKTGQRGRSYNGRVYIWGWTEGANDTTGQILNASATTAEVFVNTIKTEAAGQLQLTMCLVSRWTTPPGSDPDDPPIERNPPITVDVTLVTRSDLRWDNQRRRAIPGI